MAQREIPAGNAVHSPELDDIDRSTQPRAVPVIRANQQAITQRIEENLVHVNRLIKAPVIARFGLRLALQSSAAAVNTSKSRGELGNVAAGLRASATAVRHLALILSDAPASDKTKVGWQPYLHKLEHIQSYKNQRQIWGNKIYESIIGWQFMQIAVEASRRVYEEYPETEGVFFEAHGNIKATLIEPGRQQNQSLLIIAIKGSESRDDWLLNFNGAPSTSAYSELFLDKTTKWHKGFLDVTAAMEGKIVEGINNLRSRNIGITDILLTGHSAGGAIAQILLAASNSPNTQFYNAMQGCNIACVTFGCPPIASKPITPPASGLFIAVINGDDPVPLAQEAYIKTLIDVYTLDKAKLEEKYKVTSEDIVPDPVLRISGTCVILRDIDPDAEDDCGFEALEVRGTDVEHSLFGNPFGHFMEEYCARVNWISSRMEALSQVAV